ncbi:dihydroneopterin aldolase [Mangrovibacterium marinum]|uniref:7,8-dihydroneopterin aldolase n=1 Tax=Mangrovibacterium marinum TaxID=1639118 RepID=A0A2T5BYQ6_9BACT|nr:dihydroneopterin aldolase [Mangrovibacterium marinum]PTN07337.1 dihydroneopterin aldolase [Mangrovibacterium marinum]
MDLIELEGMEFYAYHGHYDFEQQVGARFQVSATIHTDCSKAGQTDNLDDALNYQKIYDIISEEMKVPSALLEHVCTRIIDQIYRSFPDIEKATIKLSKMNPPLGGELAKVSVQLSR